MSVLVTSSLCRLYGKAFPAFPFSRATATVATERKNGNGVVETRHQYSLLVFVPHSKLRLSISHRRTGMHAILATACLGIQGVPKSKMIISLLLWPWAALSLKSARLAHVK